MPTLDSKGSGGMKRANIRSKGLIAIGVIEGLLVIGAEPETAICPQPATRNPSVQRELCFGQGYLRSGNATAEDLRSD